MKDEIQSLDPLMSGQVMYPVVESSLRIRTRLIDQGQMSQEVGMPSTAPVQPVSTVPNRTKTEQDAVAKDRVE